jgi:GDP-L-fucose synthase
MILSGSKIYVAGHNGMVGSAIVRALKQKGFDNLVLKSSKELDLRNQSQVNQFFLAEKPEYVYLAAAKVGGILANNTYPANFLYDNMMIQNNVIHAAYEHKVRKLLFLGSSCIYPKFANQPIDEKELLSGYLESTNEAYAIAKISGIEMVKFYRRQYGVDFISAMPTNLYGINDNFDLQNSHVLPALIRKFHEAKVGYQPSVVMWGTGKAKREFLYVDDLADACLHLMEYYSNELHVNVGTGEDVAIIELANLIKKIIEYKGEIINDLSKPDGTPRKLLNVNLLTSLGWKYKTSLEQGIREVYQWYLENESRLKEMKILIMAGGSGERFWPLSTKERPKQLLPLISDKTMIRETVERLIGFVEFKDIFIATNEVQYLNIMKELPEIPRDNIIVEPAFRDTAAAILYGSTYIASRNGEDSIITVLASDHLITKREKFINSLNEANRIASKEEKIVTLGIKPTYPETGYGYIKVEDSKENIANTNVTFVEKPNLEKAKQYFSSNNFLWNSGMFIFKYKTLLANFTSHSSFHLEIARSIEGKIKNYNY